MAVTDLKINVTFFSKITKMLFHSSLAVMGDAEANKNFVRLGL